ncbi:MAG: FAD-dependent oxidoreductase [Planctomycetes bacterium]|nr:FAD-dependent oxidoreductase [Planctomycetota bacterium]MBL7037333.1 FAD-dependent oxidoreductase [Pirellulaceae bacterium]
MYRVFWTIVLSLAAVVPAAAETVLLETERFDDLGGWVVDAQFMDQMGSPYLLAHGLGVAVSDATTTVNLPEAGTYRVWVRTRDWVATWNAPGAPGKFQVLIDGKTLETQFGAEGAEWHWQDGGTVEIAKQAVAVALHDLTGFEGRCDAIVLTTEADFTPPNQEPAMGQFRRKLLGLPDEPPEAGEYDLVVVGGGIAGTCASLSAARLGLTVALIQDRPVLAGNNSSEVRVWLQGARNKEPYPRVGDVVRELEQARHAHYGPSNTADLYEDENKLAIVRAEPGISLFLCHRANAVETDDGRLCAVIAQHTTTGERRRFVGRWFVDSTGDGCIGHLAGADHELTDKGHMGRCNLWNVIDTGKPAPFQRCVWALDLTDKPFPGRAKPGTAGTDNSRSIESLGGWYWESGFDHDPFDKSEYIRDWNLRAMYGAWDALKNVDGRYANYKLNWSAYVSGKRESRRLLGDVILAKEDLLDGKEYPDGCVPTGWSIDLHLPDPRYEAGFEGDAFIAKAHFTRYKTPYWVPYRCLYSRNVTNLFMAGRDISVTHDALGSVRVMRTGGCMGEIVGMAASLCKEHDVAPRDVYKDHLDELKELMQQGVGKLPPLITSIEPPEWLAAAGENLARKAKVQVSGCLKTDTNAPDLLNDGKAAVTDNDGRWLSDPQTPNWVELVWSEPQTISAVRVISGFRDGDGQLVAPIQKFVLQSGDGDNWRDVDDTQAEGNRAVDWHVRFPPIKTSRIRLWVTETQVEISRIWEIEVYGGPKPPPAKK